MYKCIMNEAEYHFVVVEFFLQELNLLTQLGNHFAALVLINHHFVLDVSRSVGVLQSVQGFHEVTVRRRHACNHHSPTVSRWNSLNWDEVMRSRSWKNVRSKVTCSRRGNPAEDEWVWSRDMAHGCLSWLCRPRLRWHSPGPAVIRPFIS